MLIICYRYSDLTSPDDIKTDRQGEVWPGVIVWLLTERAVCSEIMVYTNTNTACSPPKEYSTKFEMSIVLFILGKYARIDE